MLSIDTKLHLPQQWVIVQLYKGIITFGINPELIIELYSLSEKSRMRSFW
jgi:hypothetical protein